MFAKGPSTMLPKQSIGLAKLLARSAISQLNRHKKSSKLSNKIGKTSSHGRKRTANRSSSQPLLAQSALLAQSLSIAFLQEEQRLSLLSTALQHRQLAANFRCSVKFLKSSRFSQICCFFLPIVFFAEAVILRPFKKREKCQGCEHLENVHRHFLRKAGERSEPGPEGRREFEPGEAGAAADTCKRAGVRSFAREAGST